MSDALTALKKELAECEEWLADIRTYENKAKRLRAAITVLEGTETIKSELSVKQNRMSRLQMIVRDYLMGVTGTVTVQEAVDAVYILAQEVDPLVDRESVANCIKHLIRRKMIIAPIFGGVRYLKWAEKLEVHVEARDSGKIETGEVAGEEIQSGTGGSAAGTDESSARNDGPDPGLHAREEVRDQVV